MKWSGPPSKEEREQIIQPLLDHLASRQPYSDEAWQNWHITPITGGRNNLLYRASNSWRDLAIKFTIRDSRHRASREYEALLALHQANLPIAPQPILLDCHRYPQPVLVQTWLDGEVKVTPPVTNTEWESLLQHFATIHTLTPDKSRVRLRKATLNANGVQAGRKIVQQQAACIPPKTQPTSLKTLLHRFELSNFPSWSDAPSTLCRVDPNSLNFIRRPGLWASVDWENSGWGDPAFEIADLMSHPAYREVPSTRWAWVIDTYGHRVGDPAAATRIQVYYKIMLVFWVARLARYLYEVPRGLDQRLVAPPPDWQTDMQAKYEYYLDLAETALLH
jgi:aminoglycoside phosphotransferase (APT) family kinase protein